MAIPAIIGSFTFLLIKRKDLDLSEQGAVFSHKRLASPMFFSLYSILAVLGLLITPAESKWGLLTMLVLYLVIFVQILSRRVVPGVVLFEIMLTLAITIYSYTLRPALYFGTTDILPHSYMTTVTYLSGHVIPAELGTYNYFPLYHISAAISSHILGLGVETALFITTGLIFASTVLFLYYFVESIFRNQQISLLAVLMYAMNASVVYYGTYMVTRTMAYVGFIVLLYLLYSVASPKPNREYLVTRPVAGRIAVGVMVIFILLTHQVSTPMIIVLIGLLLALELIIHDRRHMTPVFLMVPVSLLASYWLYVAYPFIRDLFPRAEPTLYQNVVFTEVVYLGWDFLASQIDSLFIVFFALAGATYLIWKQQPKYSIIFGILGLTAVILNVPNVLTVVFQLATVLRIDRFSILFLPFLATAMGVGVYLVTRYLVAVKVSPRWIGAVLITLIAIYGFGSLGFAEDEPDYTHYSFNQNEMTGYNYVLEQVPSGSTLYSDYYTSRFFARKQIAASESLGLPYYAGHLIGRGCAISDAEAYIILPEKKFREGGLLFGKEEEEFEPEMGLQPYLPTEENIRTLRDRTSEEDKIYSNTEISLYYLLP
jgi:hypothetical protein